MSRDDEGALEAHIAWLRRHGYQLPLAMFQASIYRTLKAQRRHRQIITLTRYGRPFALLLPLDSAPPTGL